MKEYFAKNISNQKIFIPCFGSIEPGQEVGICESEVYALQKVPQIKIRTLEIKKKSVTKKKK